MSSFHRDHCLKSVATSVAAVGVALLPLAADAQDSRGEDRTAVLEEIVVTARFREQSAQDIGQSISVLSADTLARQGIDDIADIVRATPGLNMIARGPGRNLPSIRGLSTVLGPSDILQQPALISQFLDEIPTTGPSANQPDMPLYDLDRIEVLKGPQPTYFGEGSVGGSVRYFTKNPSLTGVELRARTELSSTEGSGSLNHVVDGSIGMPIIEDILGARLTAFHRTDAGFIDSATTGNDDINDSDASGATLVLLARPTNEFMARVSAVYQKSTIDFDRIVSRPFDDLVQGVAGGLPFPGPKRAEDEMALISAKLSYVAGPVTLESVSGYYDRKFDQVYVDRAQSYFTIPGVFGLPRADSLTVNNQRDENFTQELRAITSFESPLNFVGGVYYADTQNTTAQEQRSPAFIAATGDDFYFNANTTINGEQLSFYGEAQLALFDKRLRVTAGARHFSQEFTTPILGSIKLPIGGGRIALFTLPALLGDPDAEFRNKIEKTLLRGQVEVDLAPRVLAYASVSEGARNGLFNSPATIALGRLSQDQFSTYGPDSVVAYEVGLKSTLADQRLLFNVSVYNNDWEDMQSPFTIPGGLGITANGPKARTRGAEIETTFTPNRALTMFANASYTEAKFRETAVLALGGAAGFTITPDTRIPNVPDWKFNVGAEGRRVAAFGFGDLVGNVTYQYVGDAVSTTTGQERIDSYALVNVGVGVQSDRWSTFLYADNVLNEISAIYFGPAVLGETYINRPRTIGVSARFDF